LHYAAERGQASICRLLLEQGAKVDARADDLRFASLTAYSDGVFHL